jgi:ligand-binding SRPBCC domain-containing protein
MVGVPTHELKREQVIPATMAQAWEFFSNPANLERITPPSLKIRIRSKVPERMHEGLLIRYRVKPLLGIPLTWVTEITRVEEPTCFVDEQRSGPYRLWRHVHRFEELPSGGVRMVDEVTYALPFGWLSEPVHRLLARRRLEEIFKFRAEQVSALDWAAEGAETSKRG